MSDDDILDNATAQDVVDALRLVLMSQRDPDKVSALVRLFLEIAPETFDNRGIELITRLVAEGSLKLELADGIC